MFEGVSWVTRALNGSHARCLVRQPLLEGAEVCISPNISDFFLTASAAVESVLLMQEEIGIFPRERLP